MKWALLLLVLAGCPRVVQRRYGRVDMHVYEGPNRGVDFAGDDPVIAAAPGVVAAVVHLRSYAPRRVSIAIAHEEFGVWTWYEDILAPVVERGQHVARGDVLGSSASYRVHLELCTNPLCEGQGPLGGTRDPLEGAAGCFDPEKTYPTDRLVLTYPVRC